jgi:hypothetical protein
MTGLRVASAWPYGRWMLSLEPVVCVVTAAGDPGAAWCRRHACAVMFDLCLLGS